MKLLSHFTANGNKNKNNPINWHETSLNESICYSFRDTHYERETYPSNMHYHDYYEMVIIENGDISYVCESSLYNPKRADVIVIPPRTLHMSKINGSNTRYTRHVFYFYPDAFKLMGHECLGDFLKSSVRDGFIRFSLGIDTEKSIEILRKISSIYKTDTTPCDFVFGFSYVLQFFCLLNLMETSSNKLTPRLPENIRKIKTYLDENFRDIGSVNDIANNFFYSREYVSRLFKKFFGTTVLDYIHQLRISEAQSLIESGMSMTDAAYKVGFGSVSTFIRVFESITGMKPSEYKRAYSL